MTTTWARPSAERRGEERIAQRLVQEGYDVIIEPGPDHLPPEIARLRPDILARRGAERLVVEVMRRRGGPAARVEALAREVRALPDWHFELVVLPVEEADDEPATPWSREETERRLEEAKQLAANGHLEAALLLLSAAAEAAARSLAETEHLEAQRWHAPTLFQQLVHAGLVDRADLATISRAWVARNRLAHGLAGTPDMAREITELGHVVDRMLAESHSARA